MIDNKKRKENIIFDKKIILFSCWFAQDYLIGKTTCISKSLNHDQL